MTDRLDIQIRGINFIKKKILPLLLLLKLHAVTKEIQNPRAYVEIWKVMKWHTNNQRTSSMSILDFWNPDVNFHENMTQTSENKKQFWNVTRIHTDIWIKKKVMKRQKSSMKTTKCFKIPENCAKGNSKINFQEQNRNKTIHTD